MTATAQTDEWARRKGVAHLWLSYRHMLRFELINLRSFLVIALVIQTLMEQGWASCMASISVIFRLRRRRSW